MTPNAAVVTALPLEKACSTCRTSKPLEEYTLRDGRPIARCRSCTSARKKAWRRSPGRLEQERTSHQLRYLDLKKDPRKYLWRNAKASARKRDIFFDLALEDIVVPTYCPVLGIELELPIRIKTGPGMTTDSDSIPSLDRLDSTRGYVRGNVAVISWRANKLKNSARVEELERIAAWMRARGAT